MLEANEKLELLSQEDDLTGLYNRRYFDITLQKEWQRMKRHQTPLCLIFCDVDYFKKFNDIYGHQAGDYCLRLISDIIMQTVSRSSDIAARYSGEEFAIILPECSEQDALNLVEKIQKAVISKKIPHKKSATGLVTISFGISSLIPDELNSTEVLLRQADKAVYASKEHGRNRVSLFSDQQLE